MAEYHHMFACIRVVERGTLASHGSVARYVATCVHYYLPFSVEGTRTVDALETLNSAAPRET